MDFSKKIVNAAALPIELADKYGNMDVTGGTSPSAQADAIIGNVGDKPDPLIYGGLKGFFSRVGKWIEGLPQEKFSAEQLLGQMKAAPIKKEEVDWLGLTDWLKDKASQGVKVAKSEVTDYINQHQIQMKEQVLQNAPRTGRGSVNDIRQQIKDISERNGIPVPNIQQYDGWNKETKAFIDSGHPEAETLSSLYKQLDDRLNGHTYGEFAPHYNEPDYKTPGGRNYREVLFKFGNSRPGIEPGDPGANNVYASGHFGDQGQDLLAHARVQDFKDTEGKKVMLVDELQSDWHREGRKYGYQSAGTQKPTFEQWYEDWRHPAGLPPIENLDNNQMAAMRHTYEENAARRGQSPLKDSVPDAPFKSTWHELVMKSMLRDAVEKGYDKLAWTTGKQQQDRWNLTRFFPELGWRIQPADYEFFKQRSSDPFSAPDFKVKITGAVWHGDQSVPISQLEDYVGQAAADHIRTQIKQGVEDGSLKDVKTGGEWAENLYDKQVPSFMNKYAAKWGGKVESTTIPTKEPAAVKNAKPVPTTHGQFMIDFGNARSWPSGLSGVFNTEAEAQAAIEAVRANNQQTVHSLTITPAMRASIKSAGQPLWSAIPFVGAAIAKSVHDQQKVRNYHDAQVPSR